MRGISMHVILPALAALVIASPAWGQDRGLRSERVARTEPAFDPTELLRHISYPEVAWREKLEGEVRIQVQVDDRGKPANTTIGASAHPSFSEQVRRGVMATTFRPAMKNGKPTVEWVVITVRFDLHGEKREPRIAIMKSPGRTAAMRLEAPVAPPENDEEKLRVSIRREPAVVMEDRSAPQSSQKSSQSHMDLPPPGSSSSSSGEYSVQNNSLTDDIMLRNVPVERDTPSRQGTPPAGNRVTYYSSGEVPEYDDAELKARLKYPGEALARKIEGTVVVRAFVDEHGGVIKAEIGRSDNPLLDDAARAAVLETRFVPVRRDGKPAAVWVEVPVKFRLPR